MKVLIALDATPRCGEIVTELVSRPWTADTSFLVVHVLDPFPYAKAPISLKRAKEDAASQLKAASKKLCAGGWALETKVFIGRARQELAKIAEEWSADLLVVGSNESGALTRLLLGSTARAVLRHATCSVEIVRPRPAEGLSTLSAGMRILVATDGSPFSMIALKSLAGRPWPEGSKFKVISLPEPFMPLGEFPYFDLGEVEQLNEASIKDAKRYADEGAALLTKAGWDATTAETPLPRDSDAREIVNEAERWNARMVVLGSHGRRGFDRLTLGSVSEHVALHAPCSVEVIRGQMPTTTKT
jgi:nucleotide-binding universal stress UspA family protein